MLERMFLRECNETMLITKRHLACAIIHTTEILLDPAHINITIPQTKQANDVLDLVNSVKQKCLTDLGKAEL